MSLNFAMKHLRRFFVFFLAFIIETHAAKPAQSPLIIETVISADQKSVLLKITNGLPFTINVPPTTLWNVEWEAWAFAETESNFELSTLISREFIIDTSEPSSEQKLKLLLEKIDTSNSWVALKPNESITFALIPPVEEAKNKIKNEAGKIDIVYRARVNNILVNSVDYDYSKQIASMLMTHKTSRFWYNNGGWFTWGKVKGLR